MSVWCPIKQALTASSRSIALLALGYVHDEVDSEGLAGQLATKGWALIEDVTEADVTVVNICGFEQVKKDSINALRYWRSVTLRSTVARKLLRLPEEPMPCSVSIPTLACSDSLHRSFSGICCRHTLSGRRTLLTISHFQ